MGDYDYEKAEIKKSSSTCSGRIHSFCSDSVRQQSGRFFFKTVYRTLQEIKEDGTINIGVFSDKNPFGYVDENGAYQGYDVYFANRIGEDLGVDVNFVSTEAANLCNR